MENTTDSLAMQQPLIDATEQIRSANIEKLKELMARGMLDPQFDTMMIAAKIDLLIEFAVGASVRGVFNHSWEQLAADKIAEWEQMVSRHKLTEGVKLDVK